MNFKFKKKNNKRGQLLELVIGITFLFIFSIVALVMYKASDDLNTAIQGDSTLTNETKNTSTNLNTSYPSLFDGLIGLLFIGIWLLVLVAAFQSSTNPFFLIVGIVVLVAVALVGMIANNVWDDFSNDSDYSTLITNFPITNFLINQYVLLVLVMGFSGLVVAYRSGSGEL